METNGKGLRPTTDLQRLTRSRYYGMASTVPRGTELYYFCLCYGMESTVSQYTESCYFCLYAMALYQLFLIVLSCVFFVCMLRHEINYFSWYRVLIISVCVLWHAINCFLGCNFVICLYAMAWNHLFPRVEFCSGLVCVLPVLSTVLDLKAIFTFIVFSLHMQLFMNS